MGAWKPTQPKLFKPMMLFLYIYVSIFIISVNAQMMMNMSDTQSSVPASWQYGLDEGCAICRSTGNCSLALHNRSEGVFCGEIMATYQPCCCAFRNECMTTIFSNACDCFNSDAEEELMTTRFYLFLILTFIAWALMIYDKMCSGPYKIMNSHQLLATTPSAVRNNDNDTDDERLETTLNMEEDEEMALAIAASLNESNRVDGDNTGTMPEPEEEDGGGAAALAEDNEEDRSRFNPSSSATTSATAAKDMTVTVDRKEQQQEASLTSV